MDIYKSGEKMLLKLLLIVALLCGSISPLWADMIIPIVINKKVQNVVTVARSKGDFTNIQSAIDSISDASSSNPYLIYIGPGLYPIGASPITMKEFVSITGSGEGITIISGAKSGTLAGDDHGLVNAASNTSLSNLTVQNFGLNNDLSSAIFISEEENARIENVTAKALGVSDTNSGIFIYGDNGTVIKNVTASATGGGINNYAVNVQECWVGILRLDSIDAEATGASSKNIAVNILQSMVAIRRSTLDAGGGGVVLSVLTTASSSNYKTYISQSSLLKSSGSILGVNKCASCDNGSGYDYGDTCPDISF